MLLMPLYLTAAEKEKKAEPAYRRFNNTICPVMNSKVNGKNHIVYNGIRYELCCKGCEKTFAQKPDTFLAKLPNRGKIVEGTNTTCPVMGGKVNRNVFTVYNGKKIYFCCPGCDKSFEKDPDTYLAKLDADVGTDADTPGKKVGKQ
jgi:YHS domain-containing protein